jgi:transcriptional regulator with XRE-family HTH domain
MKEVQQKLGSALRLERERRGLTLEQVSQQLKISETNLEAVENADLSALPGAMYFGLFAKSYAEFLGIDYMRTIEAIKEELGEPIDSENNTLVDNDKKLKGSPVPTDGKSIPTGDYSKSRVSYKSYVVLGVIIVIVIVVTALFFSPKGRFHIFGTEPGEQDALVNGNQADSTEADVSGEYQVVAGHSEKAVLSLEVVARDRTWATIIADGDTVLHTNLKPWREYVVGAQEKLTVSVLSPLSVEMKLNGIPIDLTNPEKGTISNVEITQENMSIYIKPAGTDSTGMDTIGTSPDSSSTNDSTPVPQKPTKDSVGQSPQGGR